MLFKTILNQLQKDNNETSKNSFEESKATIALIEIVLKSFLGTSTRN